MNSSLAPQSRRSQPSPTTRLVSRRRESVAAMLKAVPLATALLLGGQVARAQTYYRAQALPELQPQGPFGEGWTQGWALNDSGVVVGQTQALSAVRWSFAEGLQRIGSPAIAYGIANNGTAVGYLNTLGVDGIVPVRWSPTTGYSELSSVYAGAPVNGIAWAVNNQDWVLATDTTGGGNNGMLLLRPGQAALNLGLIVGGEIRFNPMINANGMVAGTTSIALGGQNIAQGFLWTEAGGARTFGALAGKSTRLGGLNDNGLVVGDTSAPVGSSIPDGFIYNANTGTLLESLPGFSPTDINNAGAIVGIQYGGGVPQGSSAAEWRNGGVVNLNSVTSDLGVYHLVQAVDINASGQILAFGQVNPALAGTNYTGPALRPFLLSECERCGQIKPNPNPAGTLLDVGPDWFDAFNAQDYRNEGTLQVRTNLANVQGSILRNGGEIDVLTSAGRLFNTGSLDNGPGGLITVSGVFDTGGAGGVKNRAAVRVLEGASMYLAGSEGFDNRKLSRFTQVGGLVRNDALFSVDEALFDQQGGSFENLLAGGTFRLYGGDAVVGGSFMNLGTVLMALDPLAPIGVPGRQSQMRISGTLENQSGAAFTAEDGSLLEVAGGQLLNRGDLTIDSSAARLNLRDSGSLSNDGGTLRLNAGSRLLVADDAGSLQQVSGQMFVANGARIEIGPTRNLDVFGGRISNEGVIVARSGAHITNSGNFQLQSGSRLELDSGASFDQGAGELYVAAGASIDGAGTLNHIGGTTTVNGSVNLPLSIFNGGVLGGSGFIGGAVVLGGTIDVRSGSSPGTLSFLGDVDMADASVELEIESHRVFDRIVVAGNLNVGQVGVKLKPSASYTPDLNDSFAWLSAGSTSGNTLQIDTSTVPSGWRSVTGTAEGTLELWNDAAVALGPNPNPTGAVLSVAAGALAYNDLNLITNGTFFNNQGTVEVAGALANRPGGYIVQQQGARMDVLAGGRLSNRGNIIEFTGQSAIDNAGTLINYQDGAINVSALANRGRIENDGTLNIQQGFENEAGGEVLNCGQISNIFTITNRGRFENRGRLDEFGFITNTSGAEFVVPEGGTVEAGPFSLGEYRDFGGITQVDGRLEGNLIRLQGALLKGHGTLAAPVELVGAEVVPDVGTGLKIEGSATGGATFYIHWTGAGQFGRLNVTGDLDLQPSTVVFVLSPDGYVPQAGDNVQWLTIGGNATGLESLDWRIVTQAADATCAGCELYEWIPPAGVSVSFSGGVLSLQAEEVPEPELQISTLRLPEGTSMQVTLTFPVLPGYTYSVESNDSPGVTSWEPLPGSPHQTGTVIDTTNESRRFYRLRRTSPDGG